jgi:cytochrome b
MKIEKKYVYDLFLRVLHLVIAASTLVLLLSAKFAEINEGEGYLRKAFWVIHIFAGYSLSIAFILRIIWGFVGPAHARFSSFFHVKEWRKLLETKNIKDIVWNWGHHPLASIAYLAFYLSVLILSISGILLSAIEHDRGPLAKWLYDELAYKHTIAEIHEAFTWIIIIFIISHIFALFYHENEDGVPVVQSMFSGFQFKKSKKENENEK